jgi:hypothetical protein
MKCNCIEKVNKKLVEAGCQYKVATTIVFDDKMQGRVGLEVPTYWIDVRKRGRKKPPSILCTFCPFCGNPSNYN